MLKFLFSAQIYNRERRYTDANIFRKIYNDNLIELKSILISKEKEFQEGQISKELKDKVFAQLIKDANNSLEILKIEISAFEKLDKYIYNQHVKNLLGEYFQFYLAIELPVTYFAKYTSSMLKYFAANNKREFNNLSNSIMDKYTYGLNATYDLGEFYLIQIFVQIFQTDIPMNLLPKISLLTKHGLCHTYFNLEQNLYTDHLSLFEFLHGLRYTSRVYYLHHHSTIAIDSNLNYRVINSYQDYELFEDTVIRITLTEFEKPSRPYFTQCLNYYRESHLDCINNCFLHNFDCVPNNNLYHFIYLNSDAYKLKFCHHDPDIKKQEKIYKMCHDNCPPACKQYKYSVKEEIIPLSRQKFFHFKLFTQFLLNENYKEIIIWYPKLTFMDLIINIANTVNLWHGTSFKELLTIFILFYNIVLRKLTRYFSNIFTLLHCRCNKPNLKNIKIIKKIFLVITSLLFFQQIISITIKYLNYETATKLDIRKNDQDTNYPFISILFEQYLIHKLVILKLIINNKPIYDDAGFKINYQEYRTNFYDYGKKYVNTDLLTVKYTEYILDKYSLSAMLLLNSTLFHNNYIMDKLNEIGTIGIHVEKPIETEGNNFDDNSNSMAIYTFKINSNNLDEEVIKILIVKLIGLNLTYKDMITSKKYL